MIARRCLGILALALWAGAALADHAAGHAPAPAEPGLLERATETLRALGLDLGGAEQPQFLPPDQAFVLSVRAAGPGEVVARWDIADHYYLYRERLSFAVAEGEASLGAPRLPPGVIKADPYFGQQEVYYGSLEARLPVRSDGSDLTLEVRYQGCADAGLCYPPVTKQVPLRIAP